MKKIENAVSYLAVGWGFFVLGGLLFCLFGTEITDIEKLRRIAMLLMIIGIGVSAIIVTVAENLTEKIEQRRKEREIKKEVK